MAFRVRGLAYHEVDDFLSCFQAAFCVDDLSLSVIRNSLINDPYFKPERVRVGLLDGEIVSHVVILHRPTWVGSQVLEVAAITAVATDPRFQGEGYGTRVMRDSPQAHSPLELRFGLAHYPRARASSPAWASSRRPVVIGHQCPARGGWSGCPCPPATGSRRSIITSSGRPWPASTGSTATSAPGCSSGRTASGKPGPRRGTFPLGFSNEVGGLGYAAFAGDRMVAYLGGQILPDMPHLAITEFAHLNDHAEAMLVLLAASRAVLSANRRAAGAHLYTAGGTPLLGCWRRTKCRSKPTPRKA